MVFLDLHSRYFWTIHLWFNGITLSSINNYFFFQHSLSHSAIALSSSRYRLLAQQWLSRYRIEEWKWRNVNDWLMKWKKRKIRLRSSVFRSWTQPFSTSAPSETRYPKICLLESRLKERSSDGCAEEMNTWNRFWTSCYSLEQREDRNEMWLNDSVPGILLY